MQDWTEVEARSDTVEMAIELALEELGLDSADGLEVEVMQEAERGGLLGRKVTKEAIVVLRPKKARSRRRRRGRGGGSRGESSSSSSGDKNQRSSKGSGSSSSGRSSGGRSSSGGAQQSSRGGGSGRSGSSRSGRKDEKKAPAKERPAERAPKEKLEVDIEQQANVIRQFLEGLLDAFGLEGAVETSVEDDIIIVNVSGDQTEALVGNKGAIMQSILELCRTIVQRKTQAGARIRIDIAGYGERRREALRIYTERLIEKVLEEGGEVMLEPMNPADRKVVHDVVGEHDGVKSFSEGEDPRRSVVVSAE